MPLILLGIPVLEDYNKVSHKTFSLGDSIIIGILRNSIKMFATNVGLILVVV